MIPLPHLPGQLINHSSVATTSPVRKHRVHVLTALRDAISGNPWTPPQPA